MSSFFYRHELAVPQHLTGGRRHLFQRFDRLFRLALLHDAENGVEQDDRHDDDEFRKGFVPALYPVDDDGGEIDRRRREQDDDHGIDELLQKSPEQRDLFRFGKFVLAVPLQPGRRLRGGEPGIGRAHLFQDVARFGQIVFHRLLLYSFH